MAVNLANLVPLAPEATQYSNEGIYFCPNCGTVSLAGWYKCTKCKRGTRWFCPMCPNTTFTPTYRARHNVNIHHYPANPPPHPHSPPHPHPDALNHPHPHPDANLNPASPNPLSPSTPVLSPEQLHTPQSEPEPSPQYQSEPSPYSQPSPQFQSEPSPAQSEPSPYSQPSPQYQSEPSPAQSGPSEPSEPAQVPHGDGDQVMAYAHVNPLSLSQLLSEPMDAEVLEQITPQESMQTFIEKFFGIPRPDLPPPPQLCQVHPDALQWVSGSVSELTLIGIYVPADFYVCISPYENHDKDTVRIFIREHFSFFDASDLSRPYIIYAHVPHPLSPELTIAYLSIRNQEGAYQNKFPIRFISSTSQSPITSTIAQGDPHRNMSSSMFKDISPQAQQQQMNNTFTGSRSQFPTGNQNGLAQLILSVLSNSDRMRVALCLAYRFVNLGNITREAFDKLVDMSSSPDFTEQQLIKEINKILNIQNFERILDLTITHIKSIASKNKPTVSDEVSTESVLESEIVCESEEDLPDNLKCAICYDLMKEPLRVPCCKQRFCTLCIAQSIMQKPTCPTCRAPLSTVDKCTRETGVETDKVKRVCEFCKSKFTWAAFEEHSKTCLSAPCRCKHGCGNEFVREKLREHEEWCAQQPCKCSYCEAEMLQEALPQHLRSGCLLSPVPPPLTEAQQKEKEAEKRQEEKEKGKEKDKSKNWFSGVMQSLGKIVGLSAFTSMPDILPGSYEDYDFPSDLSENAPIWKKRLSNKLRAAPPSTQDIEHEICKCGENVKLAQISILPK